MGSNDELSLEKLKINDRLVKVEEHMIEGVEVRKTLVASMNKLEDKMDKTYAVVFGSENKIGVVHQMQEMLKIADGIKWVLTKIFLAIVTAVFLAMLPTVFEYLAKVMHK